MNKKRGIRGYYKEEIDIDVYDDSTIPSNNVEMFDELWESGVLG